jgi:hypothetical protein
MDVASRLSAEDEYRRVEAETRARGRALGAPAVVTRRDERAASRAPARTTPCIMADSRGGGRVYRTLSRRRGGRGGELVNSGNVS